MKADHRWVLGGAWNFLARGFLLLILLPIIGCQRGSEARRPGPPALDVNSTSLSRTRVVATLDAPLLPGTNLVWCASFQLAWKEFAGVLKEEQPIVEGAEALCRQLNAAPDPRNCLPPESYYTAAGWVTDDFVARIRGDMRRKFPDAVPLRDIGPLPRGNPAAYAYLEASVPFAIPYIDSERPVAFREAGGNEVKVKMFGIPQDGRRRHGRSTPSPLMEQVGVLFGKNLMSRRDDTGEFAVDPFKQSTNVQLIVACVKPKDTLAATLQHVRNRAEATKKEAKERLPAWAQDSISEASCFDPHDTLLIPEMDWRILHHFAEFEERLFAVQSIVFQLDRHGALLRSEAAVAAAAAAVPTHFEFTKPFLVLLKKRGAEQPFFVAWIDNAELLRRWE